MSIAGWLLGTCSNVEDVKTALATISIWNAPVRDMWPTVQRVPAALQPLLDWTLPEHLAIHDAPGGDIVIELLGGVAQIHEHPLGVLTNSPTFDWRITNLRNYISLNPTNAEPETVRDYLACQEM